VASSDRSLLKTPLGSCRIDSDNADIAVSAGIADIVHKADNDASSGMAEDIVMPRAALSAMPAMLAMLAMSAMSAMSGMSGMSAMSAMSALQSDQAASGRFGNSFSAADDVHLGEDSFPVRLDGTFADKKGGSDLLVTSSFGHELQDLNLAFT
jgi:hypothetical protein